MEEFAFKEAVSGGFDIDSGYVSIFSIQGWADKAVRLPAYFDSFKSVGFNCRK